MENLLAVDTPLALFSGRRRHTRCSRDWSSDVCSSDLEKCRGGGISVGRKSTDGNQSVHVGCFLPRGFIRADKKTASHPEYSGRGQHKHCPEYDLLRNEVQKRKH